MNKEELKNNYHCFHQHSNKSVLDGACEVKDLVKKHKELGMKNFLITDHGTVSAIYDVFTECEKEGIKPIIGNEFYMKLANQEDNKRYHITSVVLNEIGWKNMLKLQFLACTKKEDGFKDIDGFYGNFFIKPIITEEMLFHFSEGLLFTSGCRLSLFNDKFINESELEAINYLNIFSSKLKNFMIEVHTANNEIEERMFYFLSEYAYKNNIPCIIANDTHYLSKGDLISWNLLTSVRNHNEKGSANAYNTSSMIKNDDFYIKTFDEIYDRVNELNNKFYNDNIEQRNEKLFEGFKILDSLTEFKWLNRKLPKLKFDDSEAKLKDILWQNLKKDFINKVPEKINLTQKDYIDRLKIELDIAKKTDNIDYFYMIAIFLKKCFEAGLMQSAGRGSAGSLLICKLIGASMVDPLEFELIIERAMNIDRPKLMDVDLDFAKSEGEKAFNILQEMFGKENICNIINYGYNGTKQSIQSIGRFFKIQPTLMDKVTKSLNIFEEEDEHGNKFTSKANQEEQFKMFIKSDFIKDFNLSITNEEGKVINYTGKDFLEYVDRLRGTINNLSIHASGILIMNEPIYEHIPVLRINDTVCCAYDMSDLEKLQGLKLDVLKITTMDLIKDGLNLMYDFDLIKREKNESL